MNAIFKDLISFLFFLFVSTVWIAPIESGVEKEKKRASWHIRSTFRSFDLVMNRSGRVIIDLINSSILAAIDCCLNLIMLMMVMVIAVDQKINQYKGAIN